MIRKKNLYASCPKGVGKLVTKITKYVKDVGGNCRCHNVNAGIFHEITEQHEPLLENVGNLYLTIGIELHT